MEPNTQDLSKFGFVELEEAGKLLTEYSNNSNVLDGDVENDRRYNST